MSLAASVRSGRRDTPGTLPPTCHDLPLSSRTTTSVLAWSKAVVDLRGSKASLIGCSCLRCWTTFRITNLAAANPHSISTRGRSSLGTLCLPSRAKRPTGGGRGGGAGVSRPSGRGGRRPRGRLREHPARRPSQVGSAPDRRSARAASDQDGAGAPRGRNPTTGAGRRARPRRGTNGAAFRRARPSHPCWRISAEVSRLGPAGASKALKMLSWRSKVGTTGHTASVAVRSLSAAVYFNTAYRSFYESAGAKTWLRAIVHTPAARKTASVGTTAVFLR